MLCLDKAKKLLFVGVAGVDSRRPRAGDIVAKVKMEKVELVVMQTESKHLVEKLQRLGMVEPGIIEDDRLIDISTKSRVNSLLKGKSAVQNALDALDKFVPNEGGIFSGIMGDVKEISQDDFDKNSENINEYIKTAYKITALNQEINDAKAEIARCNTIISTLDMWKNLDISIKFKGTEKTVTYIGTLPGNLTKDNIDITLAELCPNAYVETEIVSASKVQTAIVAICHKDDAEEVYASLRSMGFTLPGDAIDGLPEERIKELGLKIESELKKKNKAESDICDLGSQRENLKFALDYLSVKTDEYKALENLKMTDKTVVLQGYIPAACEKKVSDLVEKCSGTVVFSEPSEDDDVPVLLKNGDFSTPVEPITEMYSLPGKEDIDPSPVMAFFYYLLFGMMLSDAGYGLVMTIGTALVLKKTTVEGNMRKMLKMFFYCGISTVFWGALFGSWFGDIIPIIYTNFLNKPAPQLALWFEPIKDPIKLLLFSFIIGICHLFLGLLTAFYLKWKDGQKLDAILDTIPVMLLVIGAAPLAAGVLISVPAVVSNIAKYVALAGVVSIILTSSRESGNIFMRFFGGIYGLYNVASGYLSDILSYSRLLALGLATGSIAGVVNMMGVMPSNMVVKAILLTVVFIVGHTLNMAVNVLGAYVHTNRLQFVELFSKFYEGGGRAFSPLNIKTDFFKFKEEK